jgi:RNA polymerase sigma-70 factor (ECF subfamily)
MEALGSPTDRIAEAPDATEGAELYRRYYARLVRVCERYLGERHLAEDAAQETLLRALRYFDAYDRDRPVWPWLRAIAVRVALDAVERAGLERPSGEADELLAEEPAEPESSEQWLLLTAALSALPERQRAALVVRYVSDWSSAEAAALFGIEQNAFDQLLWRARRALAAEYRRRAAERRVDDG